MFDSLALFRLSSGQAAHAAQRQAVTAANVANADTPGFRAGAIDDFAELLRTRPAPVLRQTRPGHRAGQAGAAAARVHDAGGQAAPNGNTVALEREMVTAIRAGQEQAQALAIYRHGLTVLRLALGR